jgi:hypothetical protein
MKRYEARCKEVWIQTTCYMVLLPCKAVFDVWQVIVRNITTKAPAFPQMSSSLYSYVHLEAAPKWENKTFGQSRVCRSHHDEILNSMAALQQLDLQTGLGFLAPVGYWLLKGGVSSCGCRGDLGGRVRRMLEVVSRFMPQNCLMIADVGRRYEAGTSWIRVQGASHIHFWVPEFTLISKYVSM